MARALRLSSELVAGVLVGAVIGWGIDRLLSTSPFGLIVFFLLGFVAGIVNVVRSAGVAPDRTSRDGVDVGTAIGVALEREGQTLVGLVDLSDPVGDEGLLVRLHLIGRNVADVEGPGIDRPDQHHRADRDLGGHAAGQHRECSTVGGSWQHHDDRDRGEDEQCDLTAARDFNLMFETTVGPVKEEGATVYLRPETAQGIFLNFKNYLQFSRKKPPFGIAQIGKSFRNEITPGNFIFRTREFEQMEMEFFVKPGEDETWHEYWLEQRWNWYRDLGIREENIRFYEHAKEKLSHYSKRTVDIEYRFNFGGTEFSELEGIANRTDFDLSAHSKASGQDLSYFDQEAGERWFPYVIEPAAGVNRAMLAFMLDAYNEDEAPNAKGVMEKRTVMRLDPRLAPVKVAVLPLSRNPQLSPKAKGLAADLRKNWNIEFDDAGAIGRRYRRQDEIGTPFCVTVDFDTLEDNAVTVRERDTMKQERVSLDQVQGYLASRLLGC